MEIISRDVAVALHSGSRLQRSVLMGQPCVGVERTLYCADQSLLHIPREGMIERSVAELRVNARCSSVPFFFFMRVKMSTMNLLYLLLYLPQDTSSSRQLYKMPTKEPESVSTQGTYSPLVQKALSLGNKEYALRNYEKAVEHYSEASQLQYTGRV